MQSRAAPAALAAVRRSRPRATRSSNRRLVAGASRRTSRRGRRRARRRPPHCRPLSRADAGGNGTRLLLEHLAVGGRYAEQLRDDDRRQRSESSRKRSHRPCVMNPSMSSAVMARIRGSSAAMRRGVKARLTMARSSSWRGGSRITIIGMYADGSSGAGSPRDRREENISGRLSASSTSS